MSHQTMINELINYTEEQLKAELTRRHNEAYEVMIVLHIPEWRNGKYDIEAMPIECFNPKDYEEGKGIDGKSPILDTLKIRVVDGKMEVVR